MRELEPPATPAAAVPPQPSMVVVKPTKSRGIYIILGLFLGIFGVHDFYAGHYRRGVTLLLCTVLLGIVAVGPIISFIGSIVEICTIKTDGEGQKLT